jgi:hypothetical protein
MMKPELRIRDPLTADLFPDKPKERRRGVDLDTAAAMKRADEAAATYKRMRVQALGEVLRDAGMDRAAEHANRVDLGWTDRAFAVFCDFARSPRGALPFLTEDVREYAKAAGLPDPPDRRAWGAIPVRALKAGVIERAGYLPARDPKVHRSINPAWKGKR